MKNSCNREDFNAKKKYVFFSDPDVIVRRAETFRAVAQLKQDCEVQQKVDHSVQPPSGGLSNLPVQFDFKGLENLFSYPVQSCPFPFISAVKRKLGLGDYIGAHKRTYDPNANANKEGPICEEGIYQAVQRMDFIQSLKATDFSTRDNSISKVLMSTKPESPKETITEAMDKTTKSFDKVQRRLDFSMSDNTSIISSENIEPLKIPNLSIAPNLSKKKENAKENLREKENRSRKSKKDETVLDFPKRYKSPKHLCKKDLLSDDTSDTSLRKLKIGRLSYHTSRESDFAPVKSKPRNFATSTTKKESDKKQRFAKSPKLPRDISAEGKNRISTNESISERCPRLLDKATIRESSRGIFDCTEQRYKDDLNNLIQLDDQKHISLFDNRQLKQQKLLNQSQGKVSSTPVKEQSKRISEKTWSSNKIDTKHFISNTEDSEDVGSIIDTNTSLLLENHSSNMPMQFAKHKDDSSQHCSSTSMNKDEESYTQSTSTKQGSIINDSNNVEEMVLPEGLLDPRRISFRDGSRSPQEEFHDLVTPNINLRKTILRKKQFIQNDVEAGSTKSNLKHNPGLKMEMEQGSMQLLHPAALHMQFQADLHLLDTMNESLRKVMSVENSLYNVEHDQKKEVSSEHKKQTLSEQKKSIEELKANCSKPFEENTVDAEHLSIGKLNSTDRVTGSNIGHFVSSHKVIEASDVIGKMSKPIVKAVEVQTQTVNDIATQTDARLPRYSSQIKCSDIRGITFEREFAGSTEVPHLSLDSIEQFEDLDQIEDISLPSKLRTMSEISLHETTSSIKTETGTEISISTRDVTCSFNKYLDLEMAQLIKDEKLRYDKIEMLFKSREKTLNDRTKKLVKLEEQKRVLRDTGQDSRISSVKKKQRALLLKLQQEKDEMNRLKELHKIASQERKLMLQKQRNMFNPQMSTKNILTKLKRSADSSSPRRLSGPMKGYDIRSNSSMSSLVDSDKSQHDRSQIDARLHTSDNDIHFSKLDPEESNISFTIYDKSTEQDNLSSDKCPYKSPKEGNKSKYDVKSKKFEEKMPRPDILRIKSHQIDVESKIMSGRSMSVSDQYLLEKEKHFGSSQLLNESLNKSVSEYVKSESDTIMEELSKKSKSIQDTDIQSLISPKERDTLSKSMTINTETIPEEISLLNQDMKESKSSQVSEDILLSLSKSSKKSSKSISTEKDGSKKSQSISENKSSSKRKTPKCQKNKIASDIMMENALRSKAGSQIFEEFNKHYNKRIRGESELTESDNNDQDIILHDIDHNESSFQAILRHSKTDKDKITKVLTDTENYESNENICQKTLDRDVHVYENLFEAKEKTFANVENLPSKSQISSFAISRHSSGESERNYSKSVIVRSQGSEFKTSKKLQEILNAREAAITSRRNCVEDWMAWHAKLSAEEDRVARMEEAALKLVTTTPNVLPQQDTTISSDTSDVEGRIELLTEKLAERRMEMARLKREARRQTKQKLRAVEANLLNQIKKYDSTIYEMRKKLGSKKGFEADGVNPAAELKSLADFKVPEIPLEKIQDIYKTTDLLRSRSESDLFQTKQQQKDGTKAASGVVKETCSKNSKEKFMEPGEVKSVQISEHISSVRMDTHRSIQSIFDESISEQLENEKHDFASTSPISEQISSEKYTYSASFADTTTGRRKQINNQSPEHTAKFSPLNSTISENIKTEIGSTKFETDIPTGSDVILTDSNSTVQSEIFQKQSREDSESRQQVHKSASEYSESHGIQGTEYSQTFTEISERYSENPKTEMKSVSSTQMDNDSHTDVLDYSKTLDYVEVNHKNLNKNITSLENNLKTLSHMLLLFSKVNNGKIIDIPQLHQIPDVEANQSNTEKSSLSKDNSSRNHITNASISECVINNKSKSHVYTSPKKSTITDIENAMPVMSKEDILVPKTEQDVIDYEAKSKEILNEIEKSIISERRHDINLSSVSLDGTNLNLIINDSSPKHSEKGATKSKDKSISEHSSKSTPIEEILSQSEDKSDASDISRKSTHLSPNIIDNLALNQSTEERLPSFNESAGSNAHNESNGVNNYVDVAARDVESISSPKAPVTEDISEDLKQQASASDLSDQFKLRDSQQARQSVDSLHVTNNQNSQGKGESIVDIENNQRICDARSSTELKHDVDHSQMGHSIGETVGNLSADGQDWTISNSFSIQQNAVESDYEESRTHQSKSDSEDSSNPFSDTGDESKLADDSKLEDYHANLVSDIEDVSMFIPKGESTNIELQATKLNETTFNSQIGKSICEADDIIDTLTAEGRKEKSELLTLSDTEAENFQKVIRESVTKLLDRVEKSTENNSISESIHTFIEENQNQQEKSLSIDQQNTGQASAHFAEEEKQEIIVGDEKKFAEWSGNENKNWSNKSPESEKNIPVINFNLHLEVKEVDTLKAAEKSKDIVITELEPGSLEEETLPELEIDAKVELAEEDVSNSSEPQFDNAPKFESQTCTHESVIQIQKTLDTVNEQDSSDGEQLDNLVETAESPIVMIEKQVGESCIDNVPDSILIAEKEEDVVLNKLEIAANVETQKDTIRIEQDEQTNISQEGINEFKEKSPNLVADGSGAVITKTFEIIKDPEYEDISEESLEVSEILDKSEFSRPSSSQKLSNIPEKYEAVQKSEEVLRLLDEIVKKSSADAEKVEKLPPCTEIGQPESTQPTPGDTPGEISPETLINDYSKGQTLIEEVEDNKAAEELKSDIPFTKNNEALGENKFEEIERYNEEIIEKAEQDASSESNEGGDTPRALSEVELDSPRDASDARLDIETLNDDSSERDIVVMINELKASLEQPGLENSDFEAKLLQIKRLEIDLEIKQLKENGMTYYVREIPNKPPPPYTPRGETTRTPPSASSPSPPPTAVPSTVEELTSFTEKATAIIFKAKLANEDIMSVELPPEIYEPTKETNEIIRRDRRIYNSFLFDLCKEITANIYRSEYEKPGPSWTRPSVATKPTIRLPKTVEELTEYVSKEVATLFGFKTKLQRENMVMRWSRKRRDRVDELLAREAEAEEDEWTKFYHDELTVKNCLTTAILHMLIMETVEDVKMTYAKKRKLMI